MDQVQIVGAASGIQALIMSLSRGARRVLLRSVPSLTATTLAASLSVSVSVSLLAGCKQGDGERCEVDNDCSGGLTCEIEPGVGGRCRSDEILVADASTAAGTRLDAAGAETPLLPSDGARDVPLGDASDTAGVNPADAGAPDGGGLDRPGTGEGGSDVPAADRGAAGEAGGAGGPDVAVSD